MTRLEGYTLRRLVVPLIAIGYMVAAIILKPANNAETYPFFNWSLFSFSGPIGSDIVVMVRMVNGESINPPRFYYEMSDSFAAAKVRDIGLSKTSQRIVRALRTGDEGTVRILRRVIEDNYMREALTADYDFAIITYDPINRFQTGTVGKVEVFASFKKGVP